MTYLRTMLLTLFLLFITIDSQAQITRRVPADHPTIQQAINASVNGDTVLVSPGTYVENINFIGKAITVISEQGPEVTIIDGNQAGSVVRFHRLEMRSSILSGFTLQNGNANLNISLGDPNFHGGGISIFGASPTITNNLITNNKASSGGGGIAIQFGSPLVQANVITFNGQSAGVGSGEGGGIYVLGNSSALILNNTVSSNSWGQGGGIAVSSDNVFIADNIISNNTAFRGAGISGGGYRLIQNLIVGNSGAFQGGGIYWISPPDIIVNNTIADNSAFQGSGIFASGFFGQPRIMNNIIVAKGDQFAVYAESFSSSNSPIFKNNDVFSPQGAAYGGHFLDQTGINGNISADPLFIDPANDDFHLQTNSPSVDAGTNDAPDLPSTDLDGDPRILDGDSDAVATIDMGIDEVLPQESAFDICIQSGDSVLRINSETGDYQFTDCNGITLTGTGTLRTKGCTTTLTHNSSDRRILAMVNTCQKKGTATVQILSPRRTFNLTDLDITDGCGCS